MPEDARMATDQLRVRNKGLRRVRVSDLEDAPFNFRTHPDAQRDALEGTIEEIGYYGYPDVYETAEGKLRICDGHLRKSLLIEKYGPDTEIEVNVTDFDEAEAKMATVTHDPLAAMAEANTEKLDALLREVQTGSEAVAAMLEELAEGAGMYQTDETGMPDLPEGDRSPFQQMTFTLADVQAERVKAAIEKAKAVGPFDPEVNENSNGNALARIVEAYLGAG